MQFIIYDTGYRLIYYINIPIQNASILRIKAQK